MSVDADVIDYLVANVVTTTLVLARSAFNGPMRGPQSGVVDELAIFAIPSGGPAPETFLSCSQSRYFHQLQIFVRGKKNDYSLARDLAYECRDLLQSDASPVISGYLDVQVMGSQPLYAGEDDEGRPIFSLNIELQKME